MPYSFLLSAFEVVAVVICLSWIWVNAYHYYPMLATALGSVAGRLLERLRRHLDYVRRATGRATPTTIFEELANDPDSIPEFALPTVDVLLPAYDESAVIEHSIQSIRATNYPQEKLSLTVLVEPDDDDTRKVLDRIADRYAFDVLTVPENYPGEQNKPRALNYGFEHTSNDVVSITDAEDVVHPDLYRAVAAKLADGKDYVQGRLDMVNENDGWMNLLFRAEYGYWYVVNTWAKYNREYPIPLGGTTCFFPRELLETMSDRRLDKYGDPWSSADWTWIREHDLHGWRAWDPKNVTEDFELGLFLWQEGFRAGYLKDVPTAEESPLELHAWIRQRTRWKKGKIYTFLQYVKYPPSSLREKLHIYTQSAVPHLGPINLTAIAVLLLGANLLGYPLHPVTSIALLAGFLLAVVIVVLYVYGYWVIAEGSFWQRVSRSTLVGVTLPAYWFMQWLADIRAIRQTYAGELHWEKTTHFGRNVTDGDAAANGGVTQANGGTADGVHANDGAFNDGSATGAVGSARDTTAGLSLSTRALALLSIVSLGVALRAFELTDWSLYGDELYSVTARADLPVRELLAVPLPLDSHPPLYYLLLHYWMDAFGNGVASVRGLSVVLAAVGMVVLYLLATELFDARVGLLATGLFAVSSFHVHYGRIARMYSLFVLLTLASWYGFVLLRRRATPVTSVGYVLASALLLYTHVFGAFVLAAQWVYVALSANTDALDWRRWLGVQGAVGLLAVPWLAKLGYHVFALLTGVREGAIIDWVPRPTFGIITNTVLRYVGWPHHFPFVREAWSFRAIAAVLVIVYAATLVFAAVHVTRDDEFAFTDLAAVGQLSSLLVVPVAVPFVVSYLVVPVYFPRFTIPASLALIVLAAAGIVNITTRRHRATVLAVVLVCSAGLLGGYYTTETVADWEGSAGCIEDGARSGDVVLYQAFWTQEYLEYYQNTSRVTTHGVLPPDDFTSTRPYALNRSQVRALADDAERIWVVQYQPPNESALLSTLRSTHAVTVARNFGELDVYRLDGNASTDSAVNPRDDGNGAPAPIQSDAPCPES